MKKYFFSAFLALFLILFARPQTVLAGTPSCEWFEKNDQVNFCTGGFDSVAEGKKHNLQLDCFENCGSAGHLFTRQTVDLKNMTFATDSSGSFACVELSGIHSSVSDTVINCIRKTNGTVASCMPTIGGYVEKPVFLGTIEWCKTSMIPNDILLPKVEEAVKATLGGDLVPDPTTAPIRPPMAVTDDTFDAFNPLVIANSAQRAALSTPAGIISRVLEFAFPLAGLILFVMLVWGGFGMLSGATDKKSLDASRQRITAAIVGFLILFSSFWITRLIEMIFGLKIL